MYRNTLCTSRDSPSSNTVSTVVHNIIYNLTLLRV